MAILFQENKALLGNIFTHTDITPRLSPFVKRAKAFSKEELIPFTQIVADNEEAAGVLSGLAAMKAAGIQTSFVQANSAQAADMQAIVVLRAGSPPRHRSGTAPKPSSIKSKNSDHGFAYSTIPADPRFNRLDDQSHAIAHDKKDAQNLLLPIDNWNYQHTTQLEISMQDIISRTTKNGDLKVIGYNERKGLLRLAYCEGKGPKGFQGQYVVSLKNANKTPQFVAREWDRPENDPQWDPRQLIIKKPAQLKAIPDELYQKIFHHSFKVSYTEQKGPIRDDETLKPFKVFASKPNDADEFKRAMGETHPQYYRIAKMNNLMQILKVLDKKTIHEIYERGAKVYTGDWDGLLLSYSPKLEKRFTQVINTFDLKAEENQQNKLLQLSEEYLKQLKKQVAYKVARKEALSDFDRMIQTVSSIKSIISPVALARAGCITAHEFVYISLANYASNDPKNSFYGEQYDINATQEVFNHLLNLRHTGHWRKGTDTFELAKQLLQKQRNKGASLSEAQITPLAMHITVHLRAAISQGALNYTVPNTSCSILQNLYQHGFENHNPNKKLNLEGRWVMFLPDGGVLWGKNQKQLIATLLSGNGTLLQHNYIEVNPASEMAMGWGRIVEKQLELGQKVSAETLEAYKAYKKTITPIGGKENVLPSVKKAPMFFQAPPKTQLKPLEECNRQLIF